MYDTDNIKGALKATSSLLAAPSSLPNSSLVLSVVSPWVVFLIGSALTTKPLTKIQLRATLFECNIELFQLLSVK